jgi:hypothetical protein
MQRASRDGASHEWKIFCAPERNQSIACFAGGEDPAMEVQIMRSLMTSAALVAAMLVAGPVAAQQQQLTGTGQFCIQGATGPIKCEYPTMAACEQARPAGSADKCLSRSEAEGTVGVGKPAPAPKAPAK